MEEKTTIKFRLHTNQKKEWKKMSSEKKISLTSLIINSVENRIQDNERRKVLAFIEKQDNIFNKIETNINQVAKKVNAQKFMSSSELKDFSEKLTHLSLLKTKQNEMFENIYSLLAQ